MMPPGRTIESDQAKSYPDSTEFDSLFKKFYPSIKPSLSVREQAEVDFKAISRSFKMQGIDSAEAAKAAYKNLDPKAFYKIYYDSYRRNLTAKELKKYMEFVATPEGKHITDVWGSLQRVLSDATTYVARTVNMNLTPIRQAAREKMEKEQPPRNPDKIRPPMKPLPPQGDVMGQGNAGSRDSMIRMQRLQNKIPNPVMPSDTSHGK